MSRTSQAGMQASLPGMAAETPRDRLFLTLFPDGSAVARATAIARDLREGLGLSGRTIPGERLHVTLHFLGDHAGLQAGLPDAVRAAAARVSMPAFDLAFDRVGSFGGHRRDRPCVLQMADADTPVHGLWRQLGDALCTEGLGRWVERRFTPHMTLLYDRDAVPLQPVEPVAWRVRRFTLVHSVIGAPGYRRLGEWSLPE